MAKIPLFIPLKIKKELKDMGLNETCIKHMKPEEAWDIIEGKLSKNDYIINKITELAQKELDEINEIPKDKLNEIKNENLKNDFLSDITNCFSKN
jgi:hypothetical protein